MSRPEDIIKNLQRMAAQAGRGGPSPRGMAGGAAALTALVGVIIVGNNALFNVDGGHRAIKYTRIGGVSKEIYSEGMSFYSLQALYHD
jgi:prohibitin 2